MEMNIRQMLEAGKTGEDLVKMLEEQIKTAQKEIEKENKAKAQAAAKDEELDTARWKIARAGTEYMAALGIINPKDITKETIDDLIEVLKKEEGSLMAVKNFKDAVMDFIGEKEEEGIDPFRKRSFF